ncbi:DUF4232 domain-containing protein, partial [Kineococcus sp. R8]|uniref:DUF4232 domain-containing protein n=1 Tax=Kineococcus siccus TaxID=2696567 RepID=UPI001411D6FB
SPPDGPPQPCRTDQLVAALEASPAPGPGRGAATVVLTNLTSAPCTLVGYGGVSLRRSDGGPVPSSQVRAPEPAPARVVLAPGRGVRSTITWATVADAAVGEPAEGPCEPAPTTLQVIPPNQVPQLAVPWTAGPVCSQGTLTQTAYAG